MGGNLESENIFIPQDWWDAAEAIACSSVPLNLPITFVCGPKNCGKSTFSRHLVNVLLERHRKVAFLDTDVGQTEFTPPGLLSLTLIDRITPDLTIPCLKTPERSFFFGDISSKRDPAGYLACVFALFDYYLKEFHSDDRAQSQRNFSLPLVINTPGWVKGIGYEIMVDMLNHICPTHVVKIRITAERKNLPDGAFWYKEGNANTTLININNALHNHLNRSVLVKKDASLLRDLRLNAYFRQCFPIDMSISTIKELSRALAAHAPYEISISSIQIRHLHCQVPPAEKFHSLNASIVGLAVSSEVSRQLPQCVGLGIVRAIDRLKGVLYIITPVPQQTLEDVNLLLQGFIHIPICLLQVKGCKSPYMSADVLSIS